MMADEERPVSELLKDEWNRVMPHGIKLGSLLQEGGTSWVYLAERPGGWKTMQEDDPTWLMHEHCIVKLLKSPAEMNPRARAFSKDHDLVLRDEAGWRILKNTLSIVEVPCKGVIDTFVGKREYLVMQRINSQGAIAPTLECAIQEASKALLRSGLDGFDTAPSSIILDSQTRYCAFHSLVATLFDMKPAVLNHRDLKPANVLLICTRPGIIGTLAFPIDYQTAIEGDLDEYQGMSFGSRIYSSPEERRNGLRAAGELAGTREEITGNADVYALGLIAARMWNPHIRDDLFPDMKDITDKGLFDKKIDRLMPYIHPDVERAFSRCVTFDESTRCSFEDIMKAEVRHRRQEVIFDAIGSLKRYLSLPATINKYYMSTRERPDRQIHELFELFDRLKYIPSELAHVNSMADQSPDFAYWCYMMARDNPPTYSRDLFPDSQTLFVEVSQEQLQLLKDCVNGLDKELRYPYPVIPLESWSMTTREIRGTLPVNPP